MIQIKDFQFNMLPVNTYVVWDETKEAVIIDPGCYYPGEGDKLCDFIHKSGLKPVHLLNTHLHFDHVFGNPIIEKEFGTPAEASDLDQDWITSLGDKLGAFGMKFETQVAPIRPEYVLRDGDTVSFGNSSLAVLSVPGHSPGSLVYYNRAAGVLFSGDAIFCGSIGRTDFNDGDHKALIASLRQKVLTLPDETVILPGHGPSTYVGEERLNNPYI